MTAPGPAPARQPPAPSPDGQQARQQARHPGAAPGGRRPGPPAPIQAQRTSIPFQQEVRSDIRYERGLAVKAALALLLVGLILLAHVLWLT